MTVHVKVPRIWQREVVERLVDIGNGPSCRFTADRSTSALRIPESVNGRGETWSTVAGGVPGVATSA
jgi:hypothetical protein